MKILAIDTSTDETGVAVTQGTRVISNIIWSQASLHAKWGGVVPSLAQREHKARIDWVVKKTIKSARPMAENLDAVAVTAGPGLAVALEVGIDYAKRISQELQKPLITVNHVEGHLLSPLARPKTSNYELQTTNSFPILGFVASGGTTQFILIKKIGNYKIIARTVDDALGEALDKVARMLGLGYPGGAILEKFAKEGIPNSYSLPIPMSGKEDRLQFSYSGLKTAMYKLIESQKPLTKEKIQNLTATFQDRSFQHVEKILKKVLGKYPVKEFFFTGGVSANTELRKRIRKICKQNNISFRTPYSKKLCTDNAAMIGVAAFFKMQKKIFIQPKFVDRVDRMPRQEVDTSFPWEK